MPRAKVAAIEDWARSEPRLSASAGESVALTLDEEVFAVRGHLLTAPDATPVESRAVAVRDLSVPAVSPDGRRVVFSGRKGEKRQLFMRSLDTLETTAIPGTALAYWATAMASMTLPAVTTSLGLLATPVVSTTVATLWLGEPVTLSLVAAMILILGGIALGAAGDRRPPGS